MPETCRATKVTTPTMAGTPPGLPRATAGDATGPGATALEPSPMVPRVTTPVIDLTNNDAAMVKLFERLGALKGAASFFVLVQPLSLWLFLRL